MRSLVGGIAPVLFAVSVSLASPGTAVTLDWTPIGGAGNPADTTGYGSVASVYQIATFEVTNAQYSEFLNAVASDADLLNGADPHALYSTSMDSSPHGGITRSGDGILTDYSYAVKPGSEARPVNFVSFWDAARFANWVQNGQLSGAQDATTTEDGAYTLSQAAIDANSVARNADARIVLPTEDEWYKAAYYDAFAASYFDYPTSSNLETLCAAPTGAANSANCDAPGTNPSDADVDALTDVGRFPGSESPAGTFDQGGNVWEWNETVAGGAFRGLRGGSSDSAANTLAAELAGSTDPTAENPFFGFRVAMVPEPGAGALLGIGLVGLALCRRRRRSPVLVLAALFAASAGAPQAASAQPTASACSIVAAGAPLSPTQRARMIALRQKFFGTDYVNPLTGAVSADVVIASWITVTGYALAINGHVILLDAYIGDDSGYVPTDDCELSDLRPSFVLVGHGHFDHAELAPTVLNRNRGAIFIGAAEHCADVTLALDGVAIPNCIESMPREAPFGTTIALPGVIPGVALTAVRHPHSDAQPPNPGDPSPVVLDPAPLKPPNHGPCRALCPPPRPNFVEAQEVEDGEVSVLYQFRIGNFALTWNNTVGPNQPGAPALRAMQALPQTDVELAAILGFNVPTNGFQDARTIAQALRTRLLVPGHHDFLFPYSGDAYETAFRSEIDEIPAATRPGIVWVADPGDYLRPELFLWHVNDPIWAQTGPLAP